MEASNFTLDSDWIVALVTNHLLLQQVCKTPYALNEAVKSGPLLHFPKSSQLKHPYCMYVK